MVCNYQTDNPKNNIFSCHIFYNLNMRMFSQCIYKQPLRKSLFINHLRFSKFTSHFARLFYVFENSNRKMRIIACISFSMQIYHIFFIYLCKDFISLWISKYYDLHWQFITHSEMQHTAIIESPPIMVRYQNFCSKVENATPLRCAVVNRTAKILSGIL